MDWQRTLFVATVTLIALFGTILGLTIGVGLFFHITNGFRHLKEKDVYRRVWNYIKDKFYGRK